jgi:hypothetical protein
VHLRSVARGSSFAAALRGALLIGVLLAAETLAVAHSSDLDAHATDDVCKICLSLATFGGANVSPPAGAALDVAEPPVVAGDEVAAAVAPIRHAFARGPPHAS